MTRRLVWLSLVAMALVALPRALPTLGTSLIVDEPLQPARAAVVFGGDAVHRAAEAAAIYHRGLAPEVWVTQTEVPVQFAHEAREHHHSLQILERSFVPSTSVRVLPEAAANTAAEIRSVVRQLAALGGGRVILITSQYHSRRVRVLWDRLAGPEHHAIVRNARGEAEPERWWQRSTDVRRVSREWLGLFRAWTGISWAFGR